MKLDKDFVTKNTPGGLTGKEFTTCSRVQDKVQVAALKRLLSLLAPSVDRLFQQALADKGPWFARMALADNMVQDIMPRLSVKAK